MITYGYKPEIQTRLDEIISELNRLKRESDELGPTSIETALDYRADAWEGPYDEYQEPTPEELERMKNDAEAALKREIDIEAQHDDLMIEYYTLTDTTPHYYELSSTYARSWYEKF